MTVGQYLHIARIKKGVTQKQLATSAGITQANICNAELGKRDITMATFLRICYALKLRPHDVFLDAEVRPPKLVLTRERVEKLAEYVVTGRGPLPARDKLIANLIRSVYCTAGRRTSNKKMQLNWLELKQLLDTRDIDLIGRRVKDAEQRHP